MLKSFIQRLFEATGYSLIRASRLLVRNPEDPVHVFESMCTHLIATKQPVYFVQIGAYDGKTDDVLNKYIRRFDLRGVMVEPQPEPFRDLQAEYKDQPHISLREVAIAKERGSRTLYTIEPVPHLPEWAEQAASLDRDTIAGHESIAPGITDQIREIVVPCIPLSDLLDEENMDTVDIFQIDTEGYDYEIIKMINFEQYTPRIIRYEHAHLAREDQIECLLYLRKQGYRLAIEDMDTTAYRAYPGTDADYTQIARSNPYDGF